jgi:hypothetical protein
LERSLLFTILAHAIGMVSMAFFVLPGVPGGTHADPWARAEYVATHPWIWRLGWLPWQVTAVSDLLLSFALLRTAWVKKTPAIIGFVFTLAAVFPDQIAQFRWTWEGVGIAREAMVTGDGEAYSHLESSLFTLTAGWGAVGYILGALAWTGCFATAGVWTRGLGWLSVGTWGMFMASTAMVFAPEAIRSTPLGGYAVSFGNAIAFVLLMVWLIGVTELVMRRSGPASTHGAWAPWRHPSRSVFARCSEQIANSRFVREVGRWLPTLGMSSDIRDVVYLHYLVDASVLQHLVTEPLHLQRIGPGLRFSMFTVLIFKHGHFGPTCFGKLRRMWPSPVQSNWRLYVTHPSTGRPGVLFLSTAITSTPHALAARVLAQGVPMHVPEAAKVVRTRGGGVDLLLNPGLGSSPDLVASLAPAPEPALLAPWDLCFASYREMLAACVPQDRAMCWDEQHRIVTRQEIELSIPLESCIPLAGPVTSHAAQSIVGDTQPLCFLVPRVRFEFRRERVDR